jgi:hypothetical protein
MSMGPDAIAVGELQLVEVPVSVHSHPSVHWPLTSKVPPLHVLMLQLPATLGGVMLQLTPVTFPPSTDAHSASEQQSCPPEVMGGTHWPLHNRELAGQPQTLKLHI